MSTVRVSPTDQDLARDVAEHLAKRIGEVLKIQEFCALAVSGGMMTARLFDVLSSAEFAGRIPWKDVRLFWVDERFVPADHPDSNYGQIAPLLRKLNLPADNIHPMPMPPSPKTPRTALGPVGRLPAPPKSAGPDAAAASYEDLLRRAAGARAHPLDIVLLGLGEDGHTASLFPGHPGLNEMEGWVIPVLDSPKPPPARISLALPLINQCGEASFIVSGERKADILERVLKHPEDRLPAQRVRPAAGHVYFWVDAAAFSRSRA